MEDHGTNGHHFAFGGEQLADRSGGGRGHLDGGLVRHHLDDRLVLFNDVAFGYEPLDDLTFRNAFTNIG